jgi:hypothetical protein
MSGMVSTVLAAHVSRALKISNSERASAASPSSRRGVAIVVTHSSSEGGASSTSGADDDDEPGSIPSEAMMEFAEAGFPSDEDDVMDPRARDRAMNRVVDEIQELNKAEEEVLTAAFDLVEKLMPGSTKGLNKSAGEEVEDA